MDKQSPAYQKWLKSKAHAKYERAHNTISTTCHQVNKLDCVGHVQKCMGKNLIALAGKSKLSDGKPVGGKAVGSLGLPLTNCKSIMAMLSDGVWIIRQKLNKK